MNALGCYVTVFLLVSSSFLSIRAAEQAAPVSQSVPSKAKDGPPSTSKGEKKTLDAALSTASSPAPKSEGEKSGFARSGRPNREAMKKIHQELLNLSPEERAEKICELRRRWGKTRRDYGKMTPDQWRAKREEICKRLQTKVDDLRKKKGEGNLSDTDAQRLKQMEEVLKRFQKFAAANPFGTQQKASPAEPRSDP